MWISLCGPIGTSKRKVVDFLKKDFVFEKYDFSVEENGSAFDKILTLLMRHQERQLKIQEDMMDSEILTVRSIWDVSEVFSKVAFEQREITKEQYDWITGFVNAITDFFKPPSAIIYIKPTTQTKMASFDRILMNHGEVNQELFDLIAKAYEEFISKVKIPVIEVEHGHLIDEVLAQVEFGLSSVKTTALAENTIWNRRMFL